MKLVKGLVVLVMAGLAMLATIRWREHLDNQERSPIVLTVREMQSLHLRMWRPQSGGRYQEATSEWNAEGYAIGKMTGNRYRINVQAVAKGLKRVAPTEIVVTVIHDKAKSGVLGMTADGAIVYP